MGYHVHAHFIVPGGGISKACPERSRRDGKRWLPAQRDYLMPNKAVANILRGKFRDALKLVPAQAGKTDLFDQVPSKVWRTDWVVDIEPVGRGKSALKYLAPYIFRVAISNKRIVDFQDAKVTFKYQDNQGKWHKETLQADKFMSRFLQHVLPKGFVKVRYYGFLSPRKPDLLDTIKELFNLFNPPTKNANNDSGNSFAAEIRVMSCPKCGKPMVLVAEIKPETNRSP